MKKVLIIGAKGDLAKAIASEYAKNGYGLYLAGRNINSIINFKDYLTSSYKIDVNLKEFDLVNFETHFDFFNSLNPKPDGTIMVSGYMCDQKKCENDFKESFNTINVNYLGAVSFLNIVANHYEKDEKGFIVGVSSVAGERGRKANYIYGSSKAGFTTYLSGLRNRLYKSNINVLTVKPGYIYTKMTEKLKLPSLLTAKPDEVAKLIFNSQKKKKDVIYIKSVWRLIMLLIRIIPEWKFKKMDL